MNFLLFLDFIGVWGSMPRDFISDSDWQVLGFAVKTLHCSALLCTALTCSALHCRALDKTVNSHLTEGLCWGVPGYVQCYSRTQGEGHSAQCTVYTAQCTVHSVHCTLHSAQ